MEQNKWWSHFAGVEFLSTIVLAEPDEDEDEDEDDDEDGAGGAGGDGGDGKGVDDRDPQVKIAAQEAIIERLAKKSRKTESELEELREAKRKRDEAEMTESQKRDAKLQESQDRIDALTRGQQKLVVKNAFLESSDYQWQNPGVALRLLDMDGLDITEEDGEFTIKDSKDFKARIKALADENPYLLRSKSDDDEDEDKGKKRFVGRTGDAPKTKSKTKADADRLAVLAKYPSLRK